MTAFGGWPLGKLIVLLTLIVMNALLPLLRQRDLAPVPRQRLSGPAPAQPGSRALIHRLREQAWSEARSAGSTTYTFVTTQGPPEPPTALQPQEVPSP